MGYLLSILFFTLVSGRLSFIVDLYLNINLSDRVLTKAVWLMAMGIVMVVWVVNNVGEGRGKFKEFTTSLRKYRLLFISISLFLLTTILSAMFGYDFTTGIVTTLYYGILAILFLMGLMLLKKDDGDMFKKSVLITTLILSLVALFQYIDYRTNQNLGSFISLFDFGGFVPASFFNIRTENMGIFLRPSSLMVDTNVFAVFLSLVIVMCIDFIRKGKFRILSMITLLSSIPILLLTASRTGFLTLTVGLFLYFIIIYWKGITKLLGIGKGSGLMSILPISLSRFNLGDFSASEHINYWVQSIKIFMKYPFFGIGGGNFPKYYRENIDSAIEFATPHSVYAKVIAENGLVGVITFSFLIVTYMYNLIRRKAVLPIVIMVMVLVGNITYDFFLTPWVWFLMGAFLSDIEW